MVATRRATVRWQPFTQIGWTPAPAVLGVPHRGATQMVGMLIPHPTGGLAFFHGHTASQHYRKGEAVAPLDLCVADLLLYGEIEPIYDFEQGETVPGGTAGTLRRTTLTTLLNAGQPLVADNRARLALADEHWEVRPVVERWRTSRATGERERVYLHRGAEIFVAPWLTGPAWAVPARAGF